MKAVDEDELTMGKLDRADTPARLSRRLITRSAHRARKVVAENNGGRCPPNDCPAHRRLILGLPPDRSMGLSGVCSQNPFCS